MNMKLAKSHKISLYYPINFPTSIKKMVANMRAHQGVLS